MSSSPAVHAVLIADATFVALLPGGIYLDSTIGRLGISPETVPAAYADGVFLRPCVLVKGRAEQNTFRLADPQAQLTSREQVVELWFYEDGANAYASIVSAADRAYTLLHEKMIAGAGRLVQTNLLKYLRDATLNEACLTRADYQVIGIRKP